MTENRSKSGYRTFLHEFIKDVFVVCPQCSKQAIVRSNGFSFREGAQDVKVVCTSCGFNRQLGRKPSVVLYPDTGRSKKVTEGKHIIIGAPVDPFFHLPLWIKMEVNGNLLWAYNYEHLDFMREFVNSKLRERNGGNLNRSMGSRLPRWMTSAKNRETISNAIDKIQKPK